MIPWINFPLKSMQILSIQTVWAHLLNVICLHWAWNSVQFKPKRFSIVRLFENQFYQPWYKRKLSYFCLSNCTIVSQIFLQWYLIFFSRWTKTKTLSLVLKIASVFIFLIVNLVHCNSLSWLKLIGIRKWLQIVYLKRKYTKSLSFYNKTVKNVLKVNEITRNHVKTLIQIKSLFHWFLFFCYWKV